MSRMAHFIGGGKSSHFNPLVDVYPLTSRCQNKTSHGGEHAQDPCTGYWAQLRFARRNEASMLGAVRLLHRIRMAAELARYHQKFIVTNGWTPERRHPAGTRAPATPDRRGPNRDEKTNGLTGRPTRSRLYRVVGNQILERRGPRYNPAQCAPARSAGKQVGNNSERAAACWGNARRSAPP